MQRIFQWVLLIGGVCCIFESIAFNGAYDIQERTREKIPDHED